MGERLSAAARPGSADALAPSSVPSEAAMPRSFSGVLSVALALPLAAAVLPACSKPEPPKNVLVITLDTTRFDRLSCYGSSSPKTPHLDSIAESGVRFEHAYSVAPLTLPAHASILTGVYPLEHRILDNSSYRLLPSYTTLAEILKSHGFDTGAFVSAFVLRSEYGLDQGFDHYDDELPNRVAVGVVEAERPAEETTNAALRWIVSRKDPSQPFFAWVHYYDPHFPYAAPEAFALAHRSSKYGIYEAEIAYVDACVGNLLAGLEAKGLRERTAIVVVADHGEGLGDHGESTHGYFVYDSTLRVPFLLSAPGAVPSGRVVTEGVARTVDIVPTVCDLFGVRPPALAHGKSLLAAARGEAPMPDEAVVESFSAQLNFGWSPLRGLRSATRKFIEAPRPELFDILSDPNEARDLAAGDAAGVAALRDRLAKLSEQLAHRGGAEEESPDQVLDEAELANIETLGYIAPRRSTKPAIRVGAPEGADPKDKLPEYLAILEAKGRQETGSVESAIAIMKPVAEADPGNAAIQDIYSRMLLQAGKLDDAAATLRRARDANPDNPDVYFTLGSTELKRGNADAAAEALTQGMIVFASGGQAQHSGYLHAARVDLHMALLQLGKLPEAEKVAEELRSATHDDPEWMAKIGLSYSRLGMWPKGAAVLEGVIRAKPDFDAARVNYATALMNSDQVEKAIAVLNDGLKRNPRFPTFQLNLGHAFEKAGRVPEALRAYKAYLASQPGDARVAEKVRTLEKG